MAKQHWKRRKKDKRRPVYAWPLPPEAFRQAICEALACWAKEHPDINQDDEP
jgi:hypothetical protein